MLNTEVIILRNDDGKEMVKVPAVMTIAGSDCSGGAGIEADLKTMSAHGVYGMTCIVALTAENTQKVKGYRKTSKEFVLELLECNFEDFLNGYEDGEAPLKVIKTGMLTSEALEALLDSIELLRQSKVKIVLDPVMISTTGAVLFSEEDMKICVELFLKHAYLITPNFEEAKALYAIASPAPQDAVDIKDVNDLINFTRHLQELLQCDSVLLKGGHIPWDKVNDRPYKGSMNELTSEIVMLDVLYESQLDKVFIFKSAYIPSKNTHGSGCTLASAIASNIARGLSLKDSVVIAIDYTHRAIDKFSSKMGWGNGPLNHNIRPLRSLHEVIRYEPALSKIPSECFVSLFGYLKCHPLVKSNWKRYVNHPFLASLAKYELPFDKFFTFIRQDFFYLMNYAQVNALALSVATNVEQIEDQNRIISEIIHETKRHKERLKAEFNVDYDSLSDQQTPSPACQAYCNYLSQIGRNEDFLGIKVALAPCLHGYREAAQFALSLQRKTSPDHQVDPSKKDYYDSWIEDYVSSWYRDACIEGENALQNALQHAVTEQTLTPQRIDQLLKIFNEVTQLEISFWDEAIA